MNDTTTQRSASAAQPLKDKVSLVTGSTSGIGLGIARALAAEGSAVVLNGFGKPEEIEAAKSASKPISECPCAIPPPTCRNLS